MKNKVREQRKLLNLTQEALAEKLSVSRQTIISIESGRYIPSTLLSLKIAKLLGKEVEQIFKLEESDW